MKLTVVDGNLTIDVEGEEDWTGNFATMRRALVAAWRPRPLAQRTDESGARVGIRVYRQSWRTAFVI